MMVGSLIGVLSGACATCNTPKDVGVRWPNVGLTGCKADGKSLPGIPHRNEFVPVFGDPLCMFFGMHELNPSMSLADTIPWTSLVAALL